MVPTLVPMESEMKQAARKSPASNMLDGRKESVRLTVASMLPMTFAELAKAPAKTNIHIMSIISGVPAPRLNTLTRLRNWPRVMAMA